MPKVSIVVPVYNTEQYLKRCLDSLVNQSLDDIEIIIVNDGSTDNSDKIIEMYSQSYPQKVHVINKKNGGLSDSRNFGMNIVSGEYIGFVDSDDYVENDMFETMYNEAKKNNLDIVECDFVWEYPNEIKNDMGQNYTKAHEYFTKGRVMAWNKIYKTSIIKENNIQFPFGLRYEDVEFFYKLIPYVKTHENINKAFYHYIQRETSIANTQNERNAEIFTILNNIYEYYLSKKIFEKNKENLEYLYIRLLLGSSFLRIVKINDKNIRKKLLNQTLVELNNKFPNWKKNKLLKIKNKKNIYYKSINKFTFKIYSFIFRFK